MPSPDASATSLRQLNTIRDLFFIHNKPKDAFEALERLQKTTGLTPQAYQAIGETAGLFCRYLKNYPQAIKHFIKANNHWQAGYCAMLQGDIKQADKLWQHTLAQNPNHWCRHLFGMLTLQLQSIPSLLQIRNYLEQDICFLLQHHHVRWTENILQHSHYLAQINPEGYKLIGRSLMNEQRLQQAEGFMRLAQRNLPQDPENYFHLGEILIQLGRLYEGQLALKQCLLISPVYYPAREILEKLG